MPSYTFPEDIRLSDNAKDVISSLLVNDPGMSALQCISIELISN
jgi:hypothetical protein